MTSVAARKRVWGVVGRWLAGVLTRWTLDKMLEQLVDI